MPFGAGKRGRGYYTSGKTLLYPVCAAILALMTLHLKPRGFGDYGLFTLIMSGFLLFSFWFDANDGVGWGDAALAIAAAFSLVLLIVLARRREKATWIKQPTWRVYLLAALGSSVWLFGSDYADAYFLHGRHTTLSQFRHDLVLASVVITAVALSMRRRGLVRGQVS